MLRSISDDDLCAKCAHCVYLPGEESGCRKQWPGENDENGYVIACIEFIGINAWGENIPGQKKAMDNAESRLRVARSIARGILDVTRNVNPE